MFYIKKYNNSVSLGGLFLLEQTPKHQHENLRYEHFLQPLWCVRLRQNPLTRSLRPYRFFFRAIIF